MIVVFVLIRMKNFRVFSIYTFFVINSSLSIIFLNINLYIWILSIILIDI